MRPSLLQEVNHHTLDYTRQTRFHAQNNIAIIERTSYLLLSSRPRDSCHGSGCHALGALFRRSVVKPSSGRPDLWHSNLSLVTRAKPADWYAELR